MQVQKLPDETPFDQGAIDDDTRKYMARTPEFVSTPTAKMIIGIAINAKERGTIIPIEGSPGTGKTRALRHVAATQNNAFYIQCTRASGTVTGTLKLIGRSLGMGVIHARPFEIEEEIVRWLTDRRVLLMIDEAQHLGETGFETVRGLYDRLEEDAKIGVIFAGHKGELFKRLKKLEQLWSRCSANFSLKASPDDAEALFRHWGFDCQHTFKFIRREHENIRGDFNLRRIAQIFSDSVGLAGKRGERLSFDHIKKAWSNPY